MRRAWTGLLRWLRRPWAAVVLLALLGLSVWSLPREWRRTSTVAGWIGRPVTPHWGPAVEVYLVRENGRFVVRDPDIESFDAISRALNDPDVVVLRGAASTEVEWKGFYALTSFRKREFARVHSVRDQEVPSAEVEEGRAVFLDWLAKKDDGARGAFVERVRGGERREKVVLWKGVAHNGLTIVALVALLYSLRWNLSLNVWRKRREASRLARGECPGCRYAIEGLAERNCPECGEEWRTGDRGQKEVAEVRVVDAREIIGEGKME